MVFCSFIRPRCHQVHVKFFQSSATYLHNNSVTKHFHHNVRLRTRGGPHPSNQSNGFSSLDIGHYGLYYTIFNREADKCSSYNLEVTGFSPMLTLGLRKAGNTFPKFQILASNQNLYNNISALRSKVQLLTSPSHLLSRSYSTSSKISQVPSPAVSPIDTEDAVLSEESTDDFKTKQISKIKSLYKKEDYNLIYPIYQSLTRNSYSLDSVDLYNIVLKSLVMRELNSSIELEDVEIRLTNLLTVYQEFLNSASEAVKPNKETYDIVISALLQGSLDSSEYNSIRNLPTILYNNSFVKSQEFAVIALEILTSVKDFHNLDLNKIYPMLFKVLNKFPNLINRQLLLEVFDNLVRNADSFDYYNELIKLSKDFNRFGILESSKASYDFILHIYNSYQSLGDKFTKSEDYIIYETLVRELVKTGNFEVSTKFLDSILTNYKANFKSEQKGDISRLLSGYLTEISNYDLMECTKLMKEFNTVSFLPELTMDCNNHIINKLVARYYFLENSKTESNYLNVSSEQQNIYFQVWDILNYNLIRKDFKLNNNLISLAMDLGDHDNVYKLTKILLTSEELIDLEVFKKLLTYYAAGLEYNFNTYYQLLLSLVENQAQFYNDHGKLNDFFSDVVDFLLVSGNKTAFQSLINSPMIKEVFDKFELANDKIYGLIAFSKYLVDYTNNNQITEDDLLKVTNYQAILITEFEDPDLVYMSLDEDLSQFRELLASEFVKNISALLTQTKHITRAAYCLDFDVSSRPLAQNTLIINLQPLLNINYTLGTSKFVEYFNKGYKFSDETLFSLTNKEFLMKHLKSLNINKFVKLYLSSSNQELVKSLLEANLDKVSIALLKNMQFINEELVDLYLENISKSSNQYLFQLFDSLNLELNDEQMGKYLQILKKKGDSNRIVDIFEALPALVENSNNLAVYLDALLVNKELTKFTSIVKSKFNSKASVKELLANEELKIVMDKYYALNGVEPNFYIPKKIRDVRELGLQIFNQLGNKENLKNIYQLNSKLINVNQQMIMSILLNNMLSYKMSYKAIQNFCDISQIKKFSVLNLKTIIEIMTNFKDEVKLNLLFNKFLNNGLSSYLHFDFFEILITDGKDKIDLLKLFKNSFTTLNCEINLIKIDKFVVENKISI